MTISILHLSDIHFASEADPAMGRIDAICSAVQNRLANTTTLIVLTTGDIAQAGKATEYEIAALFYRRLASKLVACSSAKVEFAFAPGNHDLDFTLAKSSRDILLKSERATEPDILADIVAPQAPFFAFRRIHSVVSSETRLAANYSHEGGTVRTTCLNTSWCSKIRETQGQLTFPVDQLPTSPKDTSLMIYAFHHPYNWFEATNYHELSDAVSARCDLVFTGHEHEGAAYEKMAANSQASRGLFVEGAVLQDRGNSENSGFHLVGVDAGNRKHLVYSFAWTGDQYTPTGTPEWRPFHGTRPANLDDYQLREDHREYLDDLGATIRHPQKGTLHAADIFVFPDLRGRTPQGQERTVPGESLVDVAIKEKRLLISGQERSGRTLLAKRTFLGFLQKGVFPVLVDGAELKLWNDSRDNEYFASLFTKQYKFPDSEFFAQLSRSRRAVIVDNIDSVCAKGGLRTTIAALRSQFDVIVLLGTDTFRGIAEIAESSAELSRFEVLRLLPFGHVRRAQLLERWLEHDAVDYSGEFEHQLGVPQEDHRHRARPRICSSVPNIHSVDSAEQSAQSTGKHAN